MHVLCFVRHHGVGRCRDLRLHDFFGQAAAGVTPVDGAVVEFLRVLLENPEILLLKRHWVRRNKDLDRELFVPLKPNPAVSSLVAGHWSLVVGGDHRLSTDDLTSPPSLTRMAVYCRIRKRIPSRFATGCPPTEETNHEPSS